MELVAGEMSASPERRGNGRLRHRYGERFHRRGPDGGPACSARWGPEREPVAVGYDVLREYNLEPCQLCFDDPGGASCPLCAIDISGRELSGHIREECPGAEELNEELSERIENARLVADGGQPEEVELPPHAARCLDALYRWADIRRSGGGGR